MPHGEISRPMQGSSCMKCRKIWGRRDYWRALVHLLPQERTAPRVRALSSWVWNIPSHGVITATARGGERMLYAAALLQGVARSLNRIWDLLGQWDVVGQPRPVSAALQCPGVSGLLLLPSPKEAFSAQGLEGARCQLENGLVLPWGGSSGHCCREAELAG